jgi:hypothetical protein
VIVLAIGSIPLLKKIMWKPYYLILILLIPMESYLEYVNVIKNKFEQGTFFNGEDISVPKYNFDNDLETENILFLGYHIGY